MAVGIVFFYCQKLFVVIRCRTDDARIYRSYLCKVMLIKNKNLFLQKLRIVVAVNYLYYARLRS